MSEPPSALDAAALLGHFRVTREKQAKLQAANERGESFGMAYLAVWAVAEDFAMRLGPVSQRIELMRELKDWQDFLEGRSDKSPPKIPPGKFDFAKEKSKTIPSESSLQAVLPLDVAPKLYVMLAPKGKYRNRRNSIAHSGEPVSKAVYEEFRDLAMTGYAEIESWLTSNQPSGKSHG
jgi:hypothetical protein